MTDTTAQAAAWDDSAQVQGTNEFFEAKNINAYYGQSWIVQDVSLKVRRGEVLALLGRNGAGKTSTLRSIAQIGEPELQSGEIWLDGNALHSMESHALSLRKSLSQRAGRLSCFMSAFRVWLNAGNKKQPRCPVVNNRCSL